MDRRNKTAIYYLVYYYCKSATSNIGRSCLQSNNYW